jgi:integrase
MPSGSCVLKYQGKRGTVWRIKFKDASGRQVKETVGKASEGWTKRKAEAVLRARLTDVAREGYVKPEAVSFETFARGWLDTYPDTREHRRTTRADYRAMVENHLIPAFGSMRLADVRTADVDAYVAAKRRGTPPLGPRTLGGHLTRLHSIFDAARRQGLVQANPVSDAERPRVPRSRWTILSPVEIAAVMRALDEMIEEADTDAARAWRETAKAMTMAMQYAWLRRGELLGLAWRDIELSHPDGLRLHVRETWVRGYNGDPKTDEGTRTIGIDGPLAEELWQHRRRSHFAGDDERVFCHPTKGTAISGGYFGAIMKVALTRAGVEEPMREFHDWHHERGRRWDVAAGDHADGRSLRLQDDPAVHRPGGRRVRRRGAASGRLVRLRIAKRYQKGVPSCPGRAANPHGKRDRGDFRLDQDGLAGRALNRSSKADFVQLCLNSVPAFRTGRAVPVRQTRHLVGENDSHKDDVALVVLKSAWPAMVMIVIGFIPEAAVFVMPGVPPGVAPHQLAYFREAPESAPHVTEAAWPDVVVVAPATCNTVGKLVWGIADNFPLLVIRAAPRTRRVIVVPSMNTGWHDPQLQRNVDLLTRT